MFTFAIIGEESKIDAMLARFRLTPLRSASAVAGLRDLDVNVTNEQFHPLMDYCERNCLVCESL